MRIVGLYRKSIHDALAETGAEGSENSLSGMDSGPGSAERVFIPVLPNCFEFLYTTRENENY